MAAELGLKDLGVMCRREVAGVLFNGIEASVEGESSMYAKTAKGIHKPSDAAECIDGLKWWVGGGCSNGSPGTVEPDVEQADPAAGEAKESVLGALVYVEGGLGVLVWLGVGNWRAVTYVGGKGEDEVVGSEVEDACASGELWEP